MIFAVNGRAFGPVFTPRLGDNHFRIEGCGFGNAPGEVRLESESGPVSIATEMQPIVLKPNLLEPGPRTRSMCALIRGLPEIRTQ
jgi:hypothetical protein